MSVPIPPPTESPWHEAYEKLKAFVAAGATAEDVFQFAQLMRRDLPAPGSPEEHALYAKLQAEVRADIQRAELNARIETVTREGWDG
ncbi:MAG: hypothetical protein M3Y48_21720 [Actinomycetota bacterium]|nr:hypothetical protein [Actinomycetota bacterium]